MKISVINARYSHGGAGIIARDVARGMVQRGHTVQFVCVGRSDKEYEEYGYQVKELPQKFSNPVYHYFNPVLLGRLKPVLDDFRPDAIHIHNINLKTFSLSALLFSLKYPMVWTLHDIWALCMTGWPIPADCRGYIDRCKHCPNWSNLLVRMNKHLKEFFFRIARLSVVCPSKWLTSLLETSNLNTKRVFTVYNGIDTGLFVPSGQAGLAERPELPSNKKHIVFPGGKRLAGLDPAWRKGWQTLATALELVSQKRNDIHLLFVGDPIELAENFPVPVSFIKGVKRKEMPSLYKAADLFILPSLADHPALTILEAMACKVPVIATDSGGIPEAVIHRETGWLCPPQRPETLAAAIGALLSDPILANQLADRAYNYVRNNFSFEQMINNYEAVYKRTIAERRFS